MNVATIVWIVYLSLSAAAAIAWVIVAFAKGRKAERTLRLFYCGPKDLKELDYIEYSKVAKAGWFLQKSDRDIEDERRMYSSAYREIQKEIAKPAEPPNPSPVGADVWCLRCGNADRCPEYRAGKYCGGSEFQAEMEEDKHDGQ